MSPSILIVEDEPIVQFQYKLYLDERGYNCNCVSSLKEAKEIIFEGKHFDLVLLDNHLDDGDGIGWTLARGQLDVCGLGGTAWWSLGAGAIAGAGCAGRLVAASLCGRSDVFDCAGGLGFFPQ